jgi:hypothetical protein
MWKWQPSMWIYTCKWENNFFKIISNWPITNACENSSIEVPTPNKISFRSSFKILIIEHIDALAIGLN